MNNPLVKKVIIPSALVTTYALFYSRFEKYNPLLKRSLKKTFLNLFVVQVIIVFYFNKYKKDIPISNKFNPLILFTKMFLINFFFGIGHRLLHTKLLYKYHKHHHQYVETNAIAAFDVSLLEFIFSYILPALITDVIMIKLYKKDYAFVDYIFIYLLLFKSYHIHIENPWRYDPLNLIPYNHKFHITHHKTMTRNYCAPFFEIF